MTAHVDYVLDSVSDPNIDFSMERDCAPNVVPGLVISYYVVD